jgi:hypothetical protein
MRRLLPLAVLVALVVPSAATASIRLGVSGDKARFRSQTGQRSTIKLAFTRWGNGLGRPSVLDKKFEENGPIPMMSFGTLNRYEREAVTPRAIARGYGDKYLAALTHAAARFGSDVYLRPLAEMNGSWNVYCAYNANGTSRGRSHSAKSYRRAFRRMYLIFHGGTRTTINARLARLNMPRLRLSHDLPVNPLVRVVWNPQGFGNPNIWGNRANAYYPGDRFVDVVANDLYDIRFNAEWQANQRLYESHPGKAYMIGEWGLWGVDDPAFVRHMASFVRNHRRVEAVVYYRSGPPGSIFDLATKPKSRAAYRDYITPLGG